MRWKIVGADSRDGREVRTEFEAPTEQQARDLAAYNGIYVRTIEPKDRPHARRAAPADPHLSSLDALAAAAHRESAPHDDAAPAAVLDYHTPGQPTAPTMASGQGTGSAEPPEEVLFSGGNVHVTATRVIIGPTTYALRNITSVSARNVPPQGHGLALSLVTIGGFIGLLLASSREWRLAGLFFTVAAAGIFMLCTGRRQFSVRFGTASGESDVLVSTDQHFIYAVVDATNRAIVLRG